jgi:hypothetical protein
MKDKSPIIMPRKDYYEEHKNLIKLLDDTAKKLLKEGKKQTNEVKRERKKK